jgi:hypothetical protein
MPISVPREGEVRESNKTSIVFCSECHANLTEEKGWTKGKVVHCRGSQIGWRGRNHPGEHHGRVKWTCPSCGGALGCNVCAGADPKDVICQKCEVSADGTSCKSMTPQQTKVMIELACPGSTRDGIGWQHLADAAGLKSQDDAEDAVHRIITALLDKGFPIRWTGTYQRRYFFGAESPDRDDRITFGFEKSVPEEGDRNEK